MKSFPQILITFCVVLSIASAADLGSRAAAASSSMKSEAESKTQIRRLDDDEPWDNGTKVYNEFPNEGWWSGTITSFSAGSGMYTVTWEDGSTDYYDDGDKIDQMVAFAQNDPQNNPAGAGPAAGAYPAGTAISMYEDGQWYDGVVVQYGSGTYTVKWDEDDEIEQIQAGDFMDQMVQDSMGDDDAAPDEYDGSSTMSPTGVVDGPKYSNGTPVSDFEDGEWVDGKVVNFQDGNYVVQWDDEDQVEYYDSHNAEDMQELKKMSEDAIGDDDAPPASYAASEDLWAMGTPVAVREDEILWYGKIDGFRNGEYSIAWDNGENEYLDNLDLVNSMVSNAALSPKPKSGMGALGKTFLSLFIISVCVVGSAFGFKFYEKYQADQQRERDLTLEDGGDPSYRDQPDQLPKII